MEKPQHIFGRAREWEGLATFGTRPTGATGGATLGVVSGRRRQGKSFLLQALAESVGGMYFCATEATEAESLRQFTDTLARHLGEYIHTPFRDWNDAVAYTFRTFNGSPAVVAIDEFPFLSRTSPSLPSIIQRELGPGGSGRSSSARLVLCGSAMSVMGGLLAGQARCADGQASSSSYSRSGIGSRQSSGASPTRGSPFWSTRSSAAPPPTATSSPRGMLRPPPTTSTRG